jgi:AcrR family transcriptional regulator
MEPQPRKALDADTLTNIAFRVFATRGYDASSMDDVARAAGITKASIYHHTAGKEALLARGLQRALDALYEILAEPEAKNARAVDRLRYIVRRVAETTTQLLPELSVLFRVRGNSETERKALAGRRNFDATVSGLLEEAVSAGDLRTTVPPRMATRLIFGMSNSIVEWYKADPEREGRDVVESVVALVFNGLDARHD